MCTNMSTLATCVKGRKPSTNLEKMKWSCPHIRVYPLKLSTEKKGEGVSKTQAFLVTIDECTRMVAAKCGKVNANSEIALMECVIFKATKVLVSDNGPVSVAKSSENRQNREASP